MGIHLSVLNYLNSEQGPGKKWGIDRLLTVIDQQQMNGLEPELKASDGTTIQPQNGDVLIQLHKFRELLRPGGGGQFASVWTDTGEIPTVESIQGGDL